MNTTFSTTRPLSQATRSVGGIRGKPSLGLLYIWATPIVAGLVHLCTIEVGGLMLSGFIWMTMLGIGTTVFVAESSVLPDRRVTFSWIPWLPFLAWMWLSLSWCQGLQRENIQNAMLISMPVFVGMVASAIIHTEQQLQRLLTMFVWTLPLLILAFLTNYHTMHGELGNVGFRMGTLTAALVAAVFVAGIFRSRIRSWIGWGVCLLLAALPGARAATLVIMGLPLIHPRLGRWTTRAALIAGLAVLALGIFQTRHFQQRFFHEVDSRDASMDSLNTSGRGEAWPLIFNKALERPAFGFGVGTSTFYVDEVSDLGGHPHNDYLRILFELGFVGLTLFLGVIIWQSFHLFRRLRGKTGVLQHAFSAAIMGWLVFLGTSLTDNTLVYAAAYMNPLFALIGGGYGVAMRQQTDSPTKANRGNHTAEGTGENARESISRNIDPSVFRGERKR